MDGNENKPENLVKEETVEKVEENNKEKEEIISKSTTENTKVEHIKVHEDPSRVEEINKNVDNNKEKEETISKSATENTKVEHIKVHEDSGRVEEIERLQNETNNKKLVKELENIEIEMDAFSDFYNAEKEQYDNSGSLINPTGKNTSMYAEGFLEGHEILFVCLYNCDMNQNEDPCTNYKYLFEKSPKAYYFFNQCAQ